MKSKVYFCKEITPENIVKIYDKLGIDLEGKVAIKVHSGEDGNQNYLHPEFYKKIVEHVGGTIVECNTAYGGARNSTEKHLELLKKHGWNDYYKVDLMDADNKLVAIPVENGKVLKWDYVGSHLFRYDSMLVVSHFKGHPMGGYGGALKQLSIGVASTQGKAYIHSGGKLLDQKILWDNIASQDEFLESMADAASAIHNYFKGKIAYINVMANMSVDCDCCAEAEDPCLKDIGILASIDPIAIDRACLDLIINSNDSGKEHFLERVNSRHGTHTIEAAEKLRFGTTKYQLIEI